MKLQLKTKNHPKQYKLIWMNKGTKVIIDKCCFVSFFMGQKYLDSLSCDVVLMDACHILLGKPC
jgi:hypothetical protein